MLRACGLTESLLIHCSAYAGKCSQIHQPQLAAWVCPFPIAREVFTRGVYGCRRRMVLMVHPLMLGHNQPTPPLQSYSSPAVCMPVWSVVFSLPVVEHPECMDPGLPLLHCMQSFGPQWKLRGELCQKHYSHGYCCGQFGFIVCTTTEQNCYICKYLSPDHEYLAERTNTVHSYGKYIYLEGIWYNYRVCPLCNHVDEL